MTRRGGLARLAALSGALFLLRCAASSLPPTAPSAPSVVRPAEVIPADLDVVVRVDLGRMRAALGPIAADSLRRRAARAGAGDDAGRALVLDALDDSDTLWLGLRPGASTEIADHVLVLRGRFERFDARQYALAPPFSAAFDLGGGYRLYEREVATRSAPARVYVRESDLLVLVSTAEIDSVERRLEQGIYEENLEPKEEGLVSLAARPAPLAARVAERSPAAARLLGKIRRVDATLDAVAERLELELTLQMVEGASPERTAEAIRLLAAEVARQQGWPDAAAEALRVDTFGSAVLVRVSLPLAALAPALE